MHAESPGHWLQHYRDAAVHRDESPDYTYDEEDDDNDESDEEEDDEDDNRVPYCSACRRWFINLDALDQHLTTNSRHNWCFECSKDFSSPQALQQVCDSLRFVA